MKHLIIYSFSLLGLLWATGAQAQPYGRGVYGANVPYGSQTSLTIATNGNVSIPITPSDNGTLGTGSSTVSVTSTDVVGYKLYIKAEGSSNMANGPATLPASANSSPGTLSVNTWGYNTDASSNFVGILTADTLIKSATGPFTTADTTAVTYGVKVDNAKPAGNYAVTVTYTAVPKTD